MNVEAIIDKVVQSMSIKTVVGEPMQIGTLTLIPIVNVSYGFGAGGGDARAGNEPASGMGGGGGARLKVAGVLVIKGEDVKFVQTGAGGTFERLVESMPDLLEKVKIKVDQARGVEAPAP